MSTRKRARERDESTLGEGRSPKKPRTGDISWKDAFPTKFRPIVSLRQITSSRTKTFDSGHIGPLFVVKVDHFTSPNRTRLTLSESLGGDLWFECDIHHNIARINDPKIGDHIRLSLSDARPSFRARPGFYDCRVEIYGDYFLFIGSSEGGPTRFLTNATAPSSSTFDQGNVGNRPQGNTTGDFSIMDTNDNGKLGRQRRRRTKKNRDTVSLPVTLKDPPVLPLLVQEKSMDTSNISLNNSPNISSTSEPKGFSIDTSAQQVLSKTQETESAIQCHLAVPQGGYYKLDSLESLPLKSRINVIGYVTGVTEVKKSADWAKTYHLSDPSRPESMKGFTVNLFSKAVDWLPDAEVGQILILRSLLLVEFSGHRKATGYADGSNRYVWAGFDETHQIFYTNPKDRNGAPFHPIRNDSPEVRYCKELIEWHKGFHSNVIQVHSSYVFSKAGKERLISELSDQIEFFNCTIELLSRQETSIDRTNLLVTDYTSNDSLYDPAGDDLPVGHRVLQVTLFDSVHIGAKDMRVGKYYRLKNLRLNHKGSGFVAVMGSGHDKESMAYQERRIQALDLKDVGVQDEIFVKLLQRKAEYITNTPPIIEEERPSFELSYGNPRRRESANMMAPEPFLSKSVLLPPLQRPDTFHFPFHSIKELTTMNDCPNFAQVLFKVAEYRPTNLNEAVVAYCTKCQTYLPSQQRRCTNCDDAVGKYLDFRLLVALKVIDEAGCSMEVWIRRSKALGIHVTNGGPTYLDHQSIVEIVESKMREICGDGKRGRGKSLSGLVKRVDEPTKNQNEWKRVFEMERWDFF